ncbi:MAG: polysaccharide biosynthesis protein [Lachnospiraceae bacterium]|nr:polysaccharide biosynthesis protein [Lachnospiraceae bacterium]
MKQKNNLVKNASFLMIAAMISKVIGLLYKSPLSSIVGSMGMGYISLAQNAYMILLMISSFSIPQAVSKLISERLALKDYKNAQKIFKGSMIYAAVMGLVVALFCLLGAKLIIPSNQPNAVLALQVLAPTIFLSGILGVFRGYFQAYRNMMPSSLSQILEQILNAAVSILVAWLFITFISDGTEGSVAKWGAAGSTVGTGAGVVAALIFMLFAYRLNRRGIRNRIERDMQHQEESYRDIFRLIIMIVSPIILSAFVYNINGYLNGVFFSEIQGKQGMNADTISILYAEYATYFMSIINIPLTLSSAAPTSMIPEVSALYIRGNLAETRERIHQTTWLSMFISIPCAMGMAVLGHPIVSLLFHGTKGVAGNLLMMGAFTILLNGMSNISNAVLQAIGKPKIPMITAAAALAVDVAAVTALLLFTKLGVYALLVAMIIYSLVVCVLNDYYMKKYLKYKNPWKEAYLKPLLAALPMGAVAGGVYLGVHKLLHSNLISLGAAVLLAVPVYFAVYLFISRPSEQEVLSMPGGRFILKFGRKLHICG